MKAMPKRSRDLPEICSEFERTLMRQIGLGVQERSRELGLSQMQLRARVEAEGAHISRTQFSRIELGQSQLNAAEIIALVRVLEVSNSWLLRGRD